MRDYIGAQFVRQTRIKHKCHACGHTIPIGSSVETEVYADRNDGGVYRLYQCEDCDYWICFFPQKWLNDEEDSDPGWLIEALLVYAFDNQTKTFEVYNESK